MYVKLVSRSVIDIKLKESFEVHFFILQERTTQGIIFTLQSTVVTIYATFFKISNSASCTYWFHVILTAYSDYFLTQSQPVDLRNDDRSVSASLRYEPNS
jgi:hypothetical protein